VDRDRVQNRLERPIAADLASRRRRLGHAVEHLEQMPVRALVLVDRHQGGKATSGLSLRSATVKRVAVTVVLVALATPAAASAHATLVRTEPASGAVVAAAPSVVRVLFDDTVRVAPGNAAVANATNTSVVEGRPETHGRALTIPLRRRLGDGDYSVRWSIVSDDGHREQGVLAFGVGTGRASPQSVLGASSPLSWNVVVLRALYYAGLLAGAGAAAFMLLAWRVLGRRITRPAAHLMFFAMLAVFLGGSALLHAASPGTRYALVLKVAVTVSLAGGAAAALAPMYERLVLVAGAAAVVLLAAPTVSGHALDRDQPRLVSVPLDLAHAESAAVWLGGLISLVFVLPRATADHDERLAVVRRFSSVALASVALLAVTGLARAFTELGSVSQVWSTSYGRALIVKSALFLPLLGLGWLNRTMLLGAFARLRRSALVEISVLLGIVAVVAVLTELAPGKARAGAGAAAAPAPLQAAGPVALPPRDAVVDARRLGRLAVAVARTPGSATVTILGLDGTGANGRAVSIDGIRAGACGSGCYRGAAGPGAVEVTVDGRTTRFDIPERAPNGTDLLRRATEAYRSARTIVFDETLSSGPGTTIVTRFTAVAPNRLEFQTRGGPSAIIIGARRWDRDSAKARYVESPQTPIDVIRPYWNDVTNVRVVAPHELTFLDRSLPGWFHVELGAKLPTQMRMTAAAHFMVDRYVGFDDPVTVSPPSR
jgi:copper transport protein